MTPKNTSEGKVGQTPEQRAQRQGLQRIYITLVLSGLAVGGVLAAIVVWLLRHFGLTQSPGG